MKINNKHQEHLIELDEFGRIVILHQDLINQVYGAMSNIDLSNLEDNKSCGDDGCGNDAACA